MKTVRKSLAGIVAAIFLLTSVLSHNISVLAAPSTPKPKERSKVELLVKYRNNIRAAQSIESGVNTKKKLGLAKFETKKEYKLSNAIIIEIGQQDDINKVITELKNNPDVEYVQPNYKLTAFYMPEDQRYSEQWGLLNNGQNIEGQVGIAGIDTNIVKAWEKTKGNSSAVVGVLDTGIDITHPDLVGNIYINTSEIAGNGLDDDGNGYIDDINGWDFANSDNTVFDAATEDKHGTHVSGIIAAGANKVGIIGAAPGVKVMPLKFISGNTGYTSDAIEAIEYAARMGVKIINASFGGTEYNPALKDSMEQSGILFVCAAGNNGKDIAQYPVYPAAFKLPNSISVAAVNNNGELSSVSTYGADVDIAAPGVNILSTIPQNGYTYLSGTSVAAPFVSGFAALLKSSMPDMTSQEIKQRIVGNKKALPGTPSKLPNAMLDAFAAFTGIAVEGGINSDTTNTNTNTKTGDSAVIALAAVEISSALKEQIHYGETGVNSATGNYSTSAVDMSVEAPGFAVNISRTYNSKDQRATSFMGRGWTFGFEGSLKQDTTNTTLWIAKLPNGSAQVFVKNPDNTYTANDSRSTLIKQTDNTHILTTKDQYTYGFNTNGYLSWMKDRNGNTISIAVDATGKISTVTDSVGRVYSLLYNASNYITTVTEVINGVNTRVVTYHYDTQNRLDYVDAPSGKRTYYGYDSSNYLTSVKASNNQDLLQEIVYNHGAAGELQHRVQTFKDKNGLILTYNYDITNRKTTITDNGSPQRTIQKWYDTWFYITKSKDPDPQSKEVTVEYFLDTNGKNVFGEEKSIIDRNGNKTTYERDANGNIKKIINHDLSFREYDYDDKNNLIKEKDEAGKCTYYVYDEQKLKLLKKVQPLNGTDLYTENADQSKFAIVRYTYYTSQEALTLFGREMKGLLKSESDAEGNITTYTYDSYGNKKTIKDPEGNIYTNEYNEKGWLVSTITPEGYKTSYTYDNDGRIVRTVLHNGETQRTVYDADGRKKQELAPDEYVPESDGLNLPTPQQTYSETTKGYRYTYYPTGNLNTVTDPQGNVSSYTYDIYGSMLSETKPNSTIYTYEYDVMNRVKKVSFKENTTAAAVLLEEYSHSILSDGKEQKIHTKYLNDTETAVTIYTYDYAGRIVKQQNPDGGVTTTAYDANGTVASITEPNGGTTYQKYDGLNRPTEKWLPIENGKYSYTSIVYDRAGNKLSEKLGKDKMGLNETPAADRFIIQNYAYYSDGKVKTITTSAGGRTEYQYNRDGNLVYEAQYTSENSCNIAEYKYNHLGKQTEKKVYIKTGDIYGNDISNNGTSALVTTSTYDKNGNLIAITTPDGTTTIYEYDNMNRLLKTTYPVINEYGLAVTSQTSTTYDWEGKPLTTTDAMGSTTQYEYNKRGMLTKTIKTVSYQGQSVQNVSAYEYDRAGRKIIEVSPKNYDSTKATLAEMNRTEYRYDALSRVKTKTEKYTDPVSNQPISFVSKAYKYDKSGNVIKELDGEGFASGIGTTDDAKIDSGYGTEYRYNFANKLVLTMSPVSKERNLTYTTKHDYDGALRKISDTNGNGAVTCYYYNDAGNTTNVTVRKSAGDIEQIIKTSTYDLIGNLMTQKDGNGNITKFEYNVFNKLRKAVYPTDDTIPENIVTYQYDVVGNLISSVDSTETQDIYTYDLAGRVLSQTQQKLDGSEKITTKRAYDLNGNVRFETDGNGTVKENSYDGFGRLRQTKVTVKETDGRTVDKLTTFEYDANGNQTKTIDWLGNVYESRYDPINRLTEKLDPTGAVIQKLEYDRSHLQVKSYAITFALNSYATTQFVYDKNNRLVSTTDPENSISTQSYDNAGNVVTKTDANLEVTSYQYDQFMRLVCVTNAKGEKTNYIYDLAGNMITQTDGNGNVTTFEYNAANKLKRRIDHGGRTGEPGGFKYTAPKTESYTYYENGNIKTKLDRNRVVTTYTYDSHGRLLTQEAGSQKISYAYDNNGNQLTMTDNTGITVRTYDELNRVMTKTTPNLGTTIFAYDLQGIVEGITIEAGQIAEKSTDPKGNVTLKVYDKAGRLLKVKGTDPAATVYEYYPNGSRKSVQYPGGAKEEYTYYIDGGLYTLNNYKAGSTTPMDTYTYFYDSVNNQVSKQETINGVSKGRTFYHYDSLNRLEKVEEPSGKVTDYTFDKAGNRLTETVTLNLQKTVTKYIYNEQNRLLSTEKEVSGQKETTRYTYDNNGNMTYKVNETTKKLDPAAPTPKPHFGMFIPGQTDGGYTEHAQQMYMSTATYKYNEFNQLIETKSGSSAIQCKYNGDGLRVEKSVNGVITRFLYEYDKVVLEVDQYGKQVARNIYGLNLISRTNGSETLFYMYNGHADVTALLNSAGQVIGSYYYDAFGSILEKTENQGVSNPYRYSGYRFDDETGLYYLNARYYDAVTARFLSEDTYTGKPNDPLSLNLYTYCANNPIKYYDPTGHYVSEWDKEHGLKDILTKITAEWEAAKARNDASGMEAAHKAAEAERNKVRDNTKYVGSADGYTYSVSQTNTGIKAELYYKDAIQLDLMQINKGTNVYDPRIIFNKDIIYKEEYVSDKPTPSNIKATDSVSQEPGHDNLKPNGQDTNFSGYGGIEDVNLYVNNEYGEGWNVSSSYFIDGILNFTQGELEQNANNCTLASITRIMKYYRDKGYTKIPYSIMDIYQIVRMVGVEHGYDPKLTSLFRDLFVYTPFEIDNMVEDVWHEFDYEKGSADNVYLNVLNTIIDNVQKELPLLLNIADGDYTGHTVSVFGYVTYSKEGNKNKTFVAIYDGWSDRVRYIDWNRFGNTLSNVTKILPPFSKK